MNEKLIYKYLSGQTNIEEEEELLKWINESPDNKKLFFDIKAIWNVRHNVSDKEKSEAQLNQSLDQLNKRIDKISGERATNKIYSLRIWSSVAVFILLAFISYFLININDTHNNTEYIVYTNNMVDSVEVITLADGSTVWLREKARLSYPKEFSGNYREVELTGEAFFDIATNPDQPFIVRADTKIIKVLGTSFSVNTNLPGGVIETILVNGLIQLQRVGGESTTVLHPGQQALYSKDTKTLEINEVDVNVLTSWRYGLISLSDVSIRTIIQCIEDTYDVTVKMDTIPLKGRRYNFSFKRAKGADAALEQLKFMTGVPAQLE